MAAKQGVFHINLLPKESFNYTPLGRFLIWATSTGRVLVVLTEFVVLLAFGSRFYFDKKVNDLSEVIDQKQVQIEAFAETETTIRKILAKQNPIQNYLDSNISFSDRYGQLSSILPSGVKLEKLTLDSNGMALTGSANSELGFAQMLQGIKQMEGVGRILLRETNFDQNTGTVKFDIQTIFSKQ